MPELVNSSVGSLPGTSELDGTIVWPLRAEELEECLADFGRFSSDRRLETARRLESQNADTPRIARPTSARVLNRNSSARIVHYGAGNGSYCRRIEAAAQEETARWRARSAQLRRRLAAEAAAQLAAAVARQSGSAASISTADRGLASMPCDLQFGANPARPVALRDARAHELSPKRVIALEVLRLQPVERCIDSRRFESARAQLGFQLARRMLASRQQAERRVGRRRAAVASGSRSRGTAASQTDRRERVSRAMRQTLEAYASSTSARLRRARGRAGTAVQQLRAQLVARFPSRSPDFP